MNCFSQHLIYEQARFGTKEPNFLSSALATSRNTPSPILATEEVEVGLDHKDRLVGTCQDLEKSYFRLTTFPKPETVRPQPVLVKSLAHIKSRFIQTEDFDWANEQLKSVRQDITVQRLRNKFVLEVYETHARILLEHGDLDEFHQCQTMIRNLTTGCSSGDEDVEELDGNDDNDVHDSEQLATDDGRLPHLKQCEDASDEFRAYGLLYALVHHSWSELSRVLNYAIDSVSSPTCANAQDGEVHRGAAFRHAISVVKAVMHNDYQGFFKLYESAPHLSAYLMDFLVRRVRDSAYERIVVSYRPTMSVEHFREALFFQDLEETRRFLRKNAAVFVRENGEPPFWVDCKASTASLKTGSTVMKSS